MKRIFMRHCEEPNSCECDVAIHLSCFYNTGLQRRAPYSRLLAMTCALIVLLTIHTSFAAEEVTQVASEKLTLSQAQEIALKNYPEIQSGNFKVQAREENINISRSNYFPQATANAARVFADDGTRIAATNGINDPTVIDRGSYGISATQLITDFGRTGKQVDAAKSDLTAEQFKLANTREQVLLNVTRAYFDALRAKELMRVSKDTIKARHALLEQILSLKEAGHKSSLDVSIAKQSVDEAELLKLKAQNAMDDAMASLSQSLGYGEQHQFSLEEVNLTTPPKTGLEQIVHEALEQNAQLRAIKAEAESARKNYEAIKAEHYPTLNAVAYAGETPLHYAGKINDNYSAAGIVMSIPIFTGGKLISGDKKAESRANSAMRDVTDKQNIITRDVRIAWNSVQTAYKNIDVAKSLATNTSTSLGLTKARYELGKNSIVDLNQAQLDKTEAEITNANAVYDYLIKLAVLKSIVGTNFE